MLFRAFESMGEKRQIWETNESSFKIDFLTEILGLLNSAK